MYWRRSTTVKYFLATFLGAAIYAEWFIYLIQPLYWQQLECLENDTTCTKILFIADPQIQGDTAVAPPLSYIINWDSDGYLWMTFTVVMSYFKPDVLVFLGDLMDEGSKATVPQFHGYVKRLADIFDVDHEIVRVWIPGDNDIGGENEPVYGSLIAEFEKVFDQPPAVRFRNITFYKVNVITGTYPQKTDVDSKLKIVVSHYPVLPKYHLSSYVEKTLHPDIYFCAHEHESKYMTQKKDRSEKQVTQFYEPKNVLEVNFDEELQYEIYVPTCSYRMGTTRIGYGAAVIDNDSRTMRYTVFWSPSRFPYLILYLLIVIVLCVYCLVFCIARLCHRSPKSSIKTIAADMSPLLQRM